MLTGLLTPVPADVFLPELRATSGAAPAAGLALAALCVALLWPGLRRSPLDRFMALGALGSLLPLAAADPSNRLLLLPSVASAWVLGAFVARTLQRPALPAGSPPRAAAAPGNRPSRWRRAAGVAAAVLLLGVHGGAAPLLSRKYFQIFDTWSRDMLRYATEAEMPPAPEAAQARVVLLTPPNPESALFLPFLRLALGQPRTAAVWPVSPMYGEHHVVRTAADALTLVLPRPLFASTWERLFREDFRLAGGESFRRGELQITLGPPVDGQFRQLTLRLDRPLDRPEIWLLAWDRSAARWRRIQPPALGQSAAL
jgi:hypothetical protein